VSASSTASGAGGNEGLASAQGGARARDLPAILAAVDASRRVARRQQATDRGARCLIAAMHSFHAVLSMLGLGRGPWLCADVDLHRDPRFGHRIDGAVELLNTRRTPLVVGRQRAVQRDDASDSTPITVHGERAALHHVAIAIRQDMISATRAQARAVGVFARALLPQAYRRE